MLQRFQLRRVVVRLLSFVNVKNIACARLWQLHWWRYSQPIKWLMRQKVLNVSIFSQARARPTLRLRHLRTMYHLMGFESSSYPLESRRFASPQGKESPRFWDSSWDLLPKMSSHMYEHRISGPNAWIVAIAHPSETHKLQLNILKDEIN